MTKEEENALNALISWYPAAIIHGLAMPSPLRSAAEALIKSRKPDPVVAFFMAAKNVSSNFCHSDDFKDCEDCQCRRAIQAGLDAVHGVKL